MESDQAKGTLASLAGSDIGGVADAVPQLTPYDCRSFKAEYGLVDGNLIIHFFLPAHAQPDTEDARSAWLQYWTERFPDKLDVTARTYFEADSPRLVVKYTEELASWFFRGQGYAHMLDLGAYARAFLDLLDAALQSSS
jgi:hypothetical protein